jgi:diguanylate cyclase (GGDEF)-like protein/PAS domain S-box-containing protein
MITERSGYRVLLLNIAWAIVYFLLGWFGLWFATNSGNVTLVWLPAGLALAIFLREGVRYIPSVFLGAFAAGIVTGDSILVSLGIALGNTLEPLLGWWLLTRWGKFDLTLNKLSDFLLILFFAAPLSAIISTVIGVASLVTGGLVTVEQWHSAALNWWMGDMMGIILITPLIIVWSRPLPSVRHCDIWQIMGALLPSVLAFLTGQIIFLDWFADSFRTIAQIYLPFLFVSWIAISLGTRGVTFILTMIATQALLGVHQGIGYFSNGFAHTHLTNLWVYLLTLSVVGMVLATYVSEHKQAETTLQESETRFRLLLQNIPAIALQSYDENGIIRYWNKASEQLYGHSQTDAIGRDLVQLIMPLKIQQSYRQLIQEMFKTEQPIATTELSLLHKNGSKVDILAYHAYVPGRQPEVFCIAIDMAEYKRVENLLHQNEIYLRTLLNTIPDLVWLKDKEGTYLFCNPMFERLLGKKTSNIIGKTDYDLVDHKLAHFCREGDLTTIAKGTLHISEEAVTFADNHHHSLLEITKAPIYNDIGILVGVLGIARDITERKQIEEKLRTSEKRLRSIIDVSPVPMALSDKQQHINFLNSAFERILGYSTDDLHSMNDWWLKTCPDSEYRQNAQASWQVILNNASNDKQAVHPLELNIICKSGELKTVLISAVMIDKILNNVYLVIFYDITAHKQQSEIIKHNEALLCEKEGYQRALLDNFPFMVWFKDVNSRFLAVNQAFAESLGENDPEQLVGKTDFDFYPPDLAKQHQDDDLMVLQSRQKKILEEEYVDLKGSSEWVEIYKAPVIDDTGTVHGTVGFIRDITECKNNETDLRIAATAFESQDGMFVTNADRVILRVNRAFSSITGYTAEEVIGQTPMIFNSAQDDSFYAELWDCIFAAGAWQGELWAQRKNGDVYLAWLMVTPVKDKNGIITHYVTVLNDITVRKEAEEQIKQFAFYDSLTRLPNRRKLLERLEHHIAVGKREKAQFAVLMLDLDRFKAVNDSFGHLAGDELLQQVADRISGRLRSTDTVARLGGDEFVVLLADISRKEDAARVAEMIVNEITRPFQLTQHGEVQIGTSIGISLYPEHGDSPEILMDNADVALYQAKNNGRGCFAYFSESLTLATHQRLQLETKLRRGLAQKELRVYYQPKVNIETGAIIGAEALVRWQNLNELMLPNYFIPIAEETSLIIDIGAWVLYETCQQGRQWLDEGLPPLTLAVNVAAPQIKRSNIVALVSNALTQTGFPAAYLELEITERGLLETHDADTILEILENLRALGVRLSIDNFGTGYSSLTYLKRFPLDTLKIDRSFVNAISHHHDNIGIASTIIAMAHNFGFKVLAEGVETEEQLNFLREKGCDYYQGYIKSKPIPAVEFAALLQDTA